MNVRDFLDVKVICETGSLRRASALLGVSQPTLSNRVAHLEGQLGATLFERRRGQSRPTELALFIASRASGMAADAERLATEVRRVASGRTGVVRVGLAPAPARVVFPEIIKRLSTRHPDISLDILCSPTSQLAEQLVGRELDLLVCPPLEPVPASVVSELLLESDIVVVARPDHPVFARPSLTMAELFEFPIALPSVEPRYLDLLRRDHGIDIDKIPGRVLCSDPGTLARIVLQSTRFLTAVPRPYFAPELEAGLLAIARIPVPFGHSLYLHYNQDLLPLPAVTTIRNVIRETFAALP